MHTSYARPFVLLPALARIFSIFVYPDCPEYARKSKPISSVEKIGSEQRAYGVVRHAIELQL